jgi:hypothetical protein
MVFFCQSGDTKCVLAKFGWPEGRFRQSGNTLISLFLRKSLEFTISSYWYCIRKTGWTCFRVFFAETWKFVGKRIIRRRGQREEEQEFHGRGNDYTIHAIMQVDNVE